MKDEVAADAAAGTEAGDDAGLGLETPELEDEDEEEGEEAE